MGGAIFITGTDTGVGKTLVACGLAALLRESGYRVGVMKPAETGCEERDGKRYPQDALDLKRASGCELPIETICPYRLRDPLAPSVAAAREQIAIDIALLAQTFRAISAAHDITLVEGAGGLLVPLLPHYTYADFAALLKLPVIVVAANRLGMINHLLLTIEHAACRGLHVLGFVLNRLEQEPSLAAETNRAALRALTSACCLGEVPYLGAEATKDPGLSNLFAARIDLALLECVLRPAAR
ncbi:MAG TPA: dethiobiotin synthase [Candidatus Acidoferrales bacterium]|nr:dethiobiotin synthase [Candidatus Acidoferrales bacterium]